MVGPPLLKTTAEPLPADLASFLESGKGKPAIYVSMGDPCHCAAVLQRLHACCPCVLVLCCHVHAWCWCLSVEPNAASQIVHE